MFLLISGLHPLNHLHLFQLHHFLGSHHPFFFFFRMPQATIAINLTSYHAQYIGTLLNSFTTSVARKNPMQQPLTTPPLLTTHPILVFEARNITRIDSFQIFTLVVTINYNAPNHAVYVMADIEGSDLFFPGHNIIPNPHLKTTNSILKFSTGSGGYNLPPEIFVADSSFAVASLSLPLFMENLSFSLEGGRLAQIETQRGYLFLPDSPSQYLNPLSVQLPIQSVHQHPLPPSPLLQPSRQPPPPHPPAIRQPPPRRGPGNNRQDDIEKVSQCLLNLSQAARTVHQNSVDISDHHITVKDFLSPSDPSHDPHTPHPPPTLPVLAPLHKDLPLSSSAKKSSAPTPPVPDSDITPIKGANALHTDITTSQDDVDVESESYLKQLASMINEAPSRNMEQYKNGTHYDLPPHLTSFVDDLIHHLNNHPNAIILDHLHPYVFLDGNVYATEKIKLSSTILSLLEHFYNSSTKAQNLTDTISTLKSITNKAKTIVTRARSRHISK